MSPHRAPKVIVGLLALGVSSAALAADPPVKPVAVSEGPAPALPSMIDFAAGVRLQSDYNFRGITQSNHAPSLQTYFETQLFDNFLYGGFATYKTDLPTRPTLEMDLTAGIRPKLGPLQFDFGVIYYFYPNERRFLNPFAPTEFALPDGTTFTGPSILTPANTDFLEFAGKVSYTYQDALTLGANVFHTRDWLGSGAPATYVSGTAKYTLPEGLFSGLPAGFAISGELGRYALGTTSFTLGSVRLPDYTYWNAGVSYTYKNLTLDLRYHDTNLDKRECFTLTTDPRGVFTGSGRSNWCSTAFIATVSLDITSKEPGIFAGDNAAPTAPPKEASAGGAAIR